MKRQWESKMAEQGIATLTKAALRHKNNKERTMFPGSNGNFQWTNLKKKRVKTPLDKRTEVKKHHCSQPHRTVSFWLSCLPSHSFLAQREFHSHPLNFISTWRADWNLSNCWVWSRQATLLSPPPQPTQRAIIGSKKPSSVPLFSPISIREIGSYVGQKADPLDLAMVWILGL